MGPSRRRIPSAVPFAVLLLATAGCGRTELETRPWQDYDARHNWQPDVVDVQPDQPEEADVFEVEPDVEPETIDVPPDLPPDGPEDVPPDEDSYEFTGLSCMSAAMCAFCCAGDFACQLGCVTSADPSTSGTLWAIVGCATTSGCGADMACLMEECRTEIDACDGGPGGTGGCLSLAWCLVSSGCASVTGCEEQGTCYQGCFGGARPEAVGAARDLVVCVAGVCLTQCAGGLTTMDCLSCLAGNCLVALRGCIGF